MSRVALCTHGVAVLEQFGMPPRLRCTIQAPGKGKRGGEGVGGQENEEEEKEERIINKAIILSLSLSIFFFLKKK